MGGQFWEDGYFARTVGDKETKDMIKKHIEYHRKHEKIPTTTIGIVLNAPRFNAGMFTLICPWTRRKK